MTVLKTMRRIVVRSFVWKYLFVCANISMGQDSRIQYEIYGVQSSRLAQESSLSWNSQTLRKSATDLSWNNQDSQSTQLEQPSFPQASLCWSAKTAISASHVAPGGISAEKSQRSNISLVTGRRLTMQQFVFSLCRRQRRATWRFSGASLNGHSFICPTPSFKPRHGGKSHSTRPLSLTRAART